MSVTQTILEQIQEQFQGIETPTYALAPARVDLADINLSAAGAEDFPNISIIDSGDERLIVNGASDGNDRFEWFLNIRGAVQCDTEVQIPDEIAQVEAVIKLLIYNAPSLTNVLQWKFIEVLERNQARGQDRFFGWSIVRTRILYYVTAGAY